jgi:predicted secreted hydrolase
VSRTSLRWLWFGGSRCRLVLSALLALSVSCSRPVAPLADAPLPSPTPAAPVAFPRDAGPHDGLTEWWYYTGHLTASDGHAYGFEFVVFQVRRQSVPAGYLTHLAVSDVAEQRFSHQMRFAESDPVSGFPLDVGGWRLDSDGTADTIQAAMQPGPGTDAAYRLMLRLTDDKPPALHNGGYIEYGPAGGSYYYSRTRLHVSGDLGVVDGRTQAVEGIAWMDHQWGNFVVTAAGGWDWYSLQLDDQTELMLYVLRGARGETTGVYGTQVLADGSVQALSQGSVVADATGSWTSPHTGAVYPSGWRLTLPDGQRLTVEPQLADQELWFPDATGTATGAGSMAYWEGAVRVSGDRTGVGYVELTGYAR